MLILTSISLMNFSVGSEASTIEFWVSIQRVKGHQFTGSRTTPNARRRARKVCK
jgi:hypothetical protein